MCVTDDLTESQALGPFSSRDHTKPNPLCALATARATYSLQLLETRLCQSTDTKSPVVRQPSFGNHVSTRVRTSMPENDSRGGVCSVTYKDRKLVSFSYV